MRILEQPNEGREVDTLALTLISNNISIFPIYLLDFEYKFVVILLS